jgi:hypothetical protein
MSGMVSFPSPILLRKIEAVSTPQFREIAFRMVVKPVKIAEQCEKWEKWEKWEEWEQLGQWSRGNPMRRIGLIVPALEDGAVAIC